MNVVIIEDGPSIAQKMKKYIEEYSPAFNVVKILSSVEESLVYFDSAESPDLIFSDIELNDGLCFEIFEKTIICKRNKRYLFIEKMNYLLNQIK
ncbi:hypothetical protein N9358_02365 [Flavobacteriales bacterium]|nr:hypothetical protein [Flavobacteriales bacterium]